MIVIDGIKYGAKRARETFPGLNQTYLRTLDATPRTLREAVDGSAAWDRKMQAQARAGRKKNRGPAPRINGKS